MGRSKLGRMGEEQAAIQTGDASSKKGRHGKQDRIRSKQQGRWGKQGKMGETVSSNAG